MGRRLGLAAVVLALAPGVAQARDVRVDCAAGEGLPEAIAAGDRVLLERGTVCRGTLTVTADGVLVGAYGKGPRPRIEATGAEAVLIRNASEVTVQDLELVNPGDGTAKKRGVHVVADGAVVRDVTLRRLYVHDVGGNLDKDAGGSGGIQTSAFGPGARFDGLRIAGNRIEDVSRSGIFVAGTTDPGRPRATQPGPAASTGVVIVRNRIARIAGDGIVPVGTVGALVSANVVRDGNRAGRSPFDPAGMICNAGIWAFHANGTVIRRNEVSDFAFNGCDGTAFDIDYDTDGTVLEHNLSHHNEGGFLLLCTDDAPRTADVRFNLSVDDGATLHESPCRLTAQGFQGTLDGIRIHNNTWVAPQHRVLTPLPAPVPLPVLVNAGDLLFRNNLLVATTPQATPFPCGQRCDHNLFHGLPPSGTDWVLGDPRFAAPARRTTGRLRQGRAFRVAAGSPARGAGAAVAAERQRDYFGGPVPSPPSIGFHQP